MSGKAHQRKILGPEWIFVGIENGLEVYIHQENNWINLYNPETDEILED
jgi:hypothetical protein